MKMIPPRLRGIRRSVSLHRVSFHGVDLSVTVTKRAAEVDGWVRKTIHNHRHHLRDLIVGLDIKWHPCFFNGEYNPAATLQLCVGQSCLIFQLLHKDYIPDSLLAFLQNPFFTFVGVGVQDVAMKLFRDHGLIVGKVVDLRYLAAWVYRLEEFSRMGLKTMALKVLGRVMEKPLEVTLSDWDAKDLTFRQIEYGCIDAFASFQIGFDLFAMAAHWNGLYPLAVREIEYESIKIRSLALASNLSLAAQFCDKILYDDTLCKTSFRITNTCLNELIL